MRKRQKEDILISFFKQKEKYEKLASFIVHLIRDDPSSPKESLHTIIYRIKDNARLIEKIDEENKKLGGEAAPITQKNFQERIGDLLGIRLICLRLSDIKRVEAYLGLLAEEKILRFIRRPAHKRSFVLPVDPGETIPQGLDLRYSGYSSIHYQVELGENAEATADLQGLQVEFQLRTILEEAWGEIDHKYRYVFSRSGDALPAYIHTGFYTLSAYLQAAALQAEHLCRQAEVHQLQRTRKGKAKLAPPVAPEPGSQEIRADESDQATLPLVFKAILEETFGFKLAVRTLTYIMKRFDELGYAEQPQVHFQEIFTENRLQEFKIVFREVLNREAFEDKSKRNVDAINAVNFALFDEIQGRRVAREGLKSALRWRKEHSRW
ncbi:MAG: RelA/SpoT domain-containing protein [Proteobacteria bacterium]|nr:RelA/SpoT domain-containing protein [Pseudomonadota bacterium]MBU0966227.1 RelA/SpoT domain-containing protein [Pseudomonadota bacterium]